MDSKLRSSTVLSLLATIVLLAPLLLAPNCGGGGGPKVWQLITDGANPEAPGTETGADPLNAAVGKMRVALAPSGELYIVDMAANRVLVLEGGLVFLLFEEVDGVPLSEPVAVDVAANGEVYVADYGNRRIVSYDPVTETTSVVATTPSTDAGPSEVVVGGDDVLFVGEKAELNTVGGSIWKYTISLDLWEDLFPGEIMNSQSMALGADGTLYVATSTSPTLPNDAFICEYDTFLPVGAGCDVIQRDAGFPADDPASEPAMGPQLPGLFGFPSYVVDVEVDSLGVLYLLSNTSYLLYAWKPLSRGAARNPLIFRWDRAAGNNVREFGVADENWLTNAGQIELIPNGTPGRTWDKTAQAYNLEVANQNLLFFTVKGGCCGTLSGAPQRPQFGVYYEQVALGAPVFHGTP